MISFYRHGVGRADNEDEARLYVLSAQFPYQYRPACSTLAWLAMTQWCVGRKCVVNQTLFSFATPEDGHDFYEFWNGHADVTEAEFDRMTWIGPKT